jgi:hypothetical protein
MFMGNYTNNRLTTDTFQCSKLGHGMQLTGEHSKTGVKQLNVPKRKVSCLQDCIVIMFVVIIHCFVFICLKTQCFGDWILSASSGGS